VGNEESKLVHEEKIYNIILSPKLTWEGILRDIVKKEGMNPWDINVSRITEKYLEFIKKLGKQDFRISGKMILAASILVRLKSEYFDHNALVRKDYYLSELAGILNVLKQNKQEAIINVPQDFEIIPNLSPTRFRKVTIDELVEALNQSMKVLNRKKERMRQRKKIEKMKYKFKPFNIADKIKKLYSRINQLLSIKKEEEILFNELLEKKTKKDIIWTFIPLLQLANDNKIILKQEKEFGDIRIGKQK